MQKRKRKINLSTYQPNKNLVVGHRKIFPADKTLTLYFVTLFQCISTKSHYYHIYHVVVDRSIVHWQWLLNVNRHKLSTNIVITCALLIIAIVHLNSLPDINTYMHIDTYRHVALPTTSLDLVTVPKALVAVQLYVPGVLAMIVTV